MHQSFSRIRQQQGSFWRLKGLIGVTSFASATPLPLSSSSTRTQTSGSRIGAAAGGGSRFPLLSPSGQLLLLGLAAAAQQGKRTSPGLLLIHWPVL